MYLKHNEKSLFDSVKTRNTDIFSYTSFYKNNSNDSYKDQYSECFLDFRNNQIYYIWKKNNLIRLSLSSAEQSRAFMHTGA